MTRAKFRMWFSGEEEKKMIYSDHMGYKYDKIDLSEFFDLFDAEKDILMRATGLEDENDKDIFFEDIIEFTFFDENEPIESRHGGTAIVRETMNGGAGILYDWIDFDKGICQAVSEGGEMCDLWEDENLWKVKVIGNTHQNPELIKQVKHE